MNPIKVIIQNDFYSVEDVLSKPNCLFVFGDNLIAKGKAKGAGQAIIRDCPNSIGIPVKRLPSMKNGSFFSDLPDEEKAIKESLSKINSKLNSYDYIVFPFQGIGTGRALMYKTSPVLFQRLCQYLLLKYNFDNSVK